MAVFATKRNTNVFSLTDTSVDATSKLVANAFVKQAYNLLKGEGHDFILGTVSNNGQDYAIVAYAEVELINERAAVILRHAKVDLSPDTI